MKNIAQFDKLLLAIFMIEYRKDSLRLSYYHGTPIGRANQINYRKIDMANSDDSILHYEKDGVEYFTIKESGKSGLSGAGMGRSLGVTRQAISNLAKKVTKAVSSVELPESLKGLFGKPLTLSIGGSYKNVTVYTSECWAAFTEYYCLDAQKTTYEARVVFRLTNRLGAERYIQTLTGWLPPEYNSSPDVIEAINRIMDQARPPHPLFGDENVQKVANFLKCSRDCPKIANWWWRLT